MVVFCRHRRAAATWLAVGVLAACRDTPPTAAHPGERLDAQAQLERADLRFENGRYFAAGRLIVRYRERADHDAVESRHRVRHSERLRLPRTEILSVDPGRELEVASALAADPEIEIVVTDDAYLVTPCAVGPCDGPSDGYFTRKWDLHNDGFVRDRLSAPTVLSATGKVDADIDWLEMYDRLGGSFAGAAIIGIVDTGIMDSHQDLTGRVLAQQNFAFGYPATLIQDRDSHGTHVAGIAAGRGNNAVGVAGVAYGPNIKLLNAKACDRYLTKTAEGKDTVVTSCFQSSVANAIAWAADNGANVINLSLGGGAPSAAHQAALQYARSKGALPVCATGNNNGPVSTPAAFPECFAVGATDWSDQKASYSNFGPEIDIAAPGGAGNPAGTSHSLILSAGLSTATPPAVNLYSFKAGTSMAAPQVTGLAALLYATGVARTPDEIVARIRSTADDLGAPGFDNQFGAGRINAYRAITGIDPDAAPYARITGTYPPILEGGSIAFSSAGSYDPNGKAITYAWTFGDGTASTAENPTKTYLDDCPSCAVNLTVTDPAGRTGSASTTVAVSNALPAVQLTLDQVNVVSGTTVRAEGILSDAGANDAPWKWSIDWGFGAPLAGETSDQFASIVRTRRYCGIGTYPVSISVTDKDGGAGTASGTISVVRRALSIVAPTSVGSSSIGQLPVTLLGSAEFAVSSVNLATVTLGNGSGIETPISPKNSGGLMTEAGDVNLDGYADLTMYFSRASLNGSGDLPAAGSATLVLLGVLTDGCVQVRATAPIKVVPDTKVKVVE